MSYPITSDLFQAISDTFSCKQELPHKSNSGYYFLAPHVVQNFAQEIVFDLEGDQMQDPRQNFLKAIDEIIAMYKEYGDRFQEETVSVLIEALEDRLKAYQADEKDQVRREQWKKRISILEMPEITDRDRAPNMYHDRRAATGVQPFDDNKPYNKSGGHFEKGEEKPVWSSFHKGDKWRDRTTKNPDDYDLSP